MLRPRIANRQQTSLSPFDPTDGEVNIPIQTQIFGLREILSTSVLINPIFRRMWGNSSPGHNHADADRCTEYSSRDAVRVAALCRGLIAVYTDGIAIGGSLLPLRCGSICGIEVDIDCDGADIRAIVRLSGRHHLRMSDIVAGFSPLSGATWQRVALFGACTGGVARTRLPTEFRPHVGDSRGIGYVHHIARILYGFDLFYFEIRMNFDPQFQK